MAISTKDLTVSVKQLMSLPLRQRQEIVSRGLLDTFINQLTPSQIAKVFPSYVKDFTTGGVQKGGAGVGAGNYPAGGTGGGGGGGRVTPKQSTVVPPPEIAGGRFQGGPQGSSQETTGYGPADQKQVPVIKDIGNGSKLTEAQRVAIVKKTQVQELVKLGYAPDVANRMAAAFGGNARAESSLDPTVSHDNGTGYGIYGARLERRDAMFAWLQKNGYDKDSLVGQARYMIVEAHEKFPNMMNNLSSMDNIGDMTTEVMKTFESPSVPRLQARLEGASIFDGANTEGVALDGSTTQQIESFFDQAEPQQTALINQSQRNEETATPLLGNATFYDDILAKYPDKIDVNSDLWDKIDPSLAAFKNNLVSSKTGLVNVATLLAADAEAKVLRKNGYEPRPVSGGDLHSENHGDNRDANYAIDMAASKTDKSGNTVDVHGGDLPRDIRFEMIGAAKVATQNSDQNFRAGLPADGDSRSVHIQSDPDKPAAFWGYTPGVRGDVHITSTESGNALLSYMTDLNKMTPADKTKYLSDTTGLKIDSPDTTASAAETKAEAAPQTASVGTAATPNAVDGTSPPTAAPIVKPTTISDIMGTTTGTNATIAAAGGAEIQKPYVAQPVDGAGPDILMGETGPERIVPRHRADDFGIQSYQMTQLPEPVPAKSDVVGLQNIQKPQYLPKPTFAQEPKMTTIAAEHTPIPPSLRKQYADSKMENRLDNLSPVGSVYSNFGFA